MQRPQHVRCPTCSTTLAPPPGAPVFRCPCGTHLRAPNQGVQATSQARLDPDQRRVSAEMRALDTPDEVVANLMHRRAELQWIRVLSKDGSCLVWKNLQSDDDERRKFLLEEKCINELEENVEKLQSKDMAKKLEAMQISTNDCIEKDDLKDKLKNAPSILMRESVGVLKQRLDDMGIDYDDLLEKDELVNRLITAAWFDGLYEEGHVRDILPDHSLTWTPASKYRVNPRDSPHPVEARLLEHMSAQPFTTKLKWFREQCAAMKIKWEDGRVQIKIRRSELLRDSFTNLNKLSAKDMHRYFRFEFIGEPGIDAGGVAREWFQLVTDQCFNVDFGLFEYSGVDNICYQINPSSGIANELHLKYFYFLGRVMGKALFDGHVIGAHVTQPLYKHILGWPIGQKDIEFVDAQVHKSMNDIKGIDDVEYLYLDFTTAVRVFGETQTVELMPGGADVDVTNDNREQYLLLLVKYILFDRIAPQLAMLLRGFYEVIPPNLLSIFDNNELELLICGLPNINVKDWMENTKYRGEFAGTGAKHQVVAWFWQVMESFSEEEKARFLQFATGTSRVPVQGFSALQGNDGNIKLFTIDSVKFETSVFPKAHTCFNRIELPLYQSKAQMKKFILQALSLEATGFAEE